MMTILLCFLAMVAGMVGGLAAHLLLTTAMQSRFRAAMEARIGTVGPAVSKMIRAWETKAKAESAALHQRVMALEAKRK